MDTALLYPLLAAAGIAAGFINTMAGGGSMLTLPALMLLGLPADVANGTNRLSVVSQSTAGLLSFRRRGKLDDRALVPLLAPTVAGALVGAVSAASIPAELLEVVLLGTMMTMAVVIALAPKSAFAPAGSEPARGRRRWVGVAGMFVAGLYGGFIQAGVGFLLLGALSGVLRYDLVRANALKLACVAVFGVAALAVFVVAGQVAWAPAVVLAAATVVGSLLGVRFALRVPQAVLRWIVLGCVLATCAAALLRG
ncbi:sulfite exporter TauE/SafE family protein [Haliangium sp.]|uniref:sulfite exporter TauE/SafE family protein n=1 Tax=Haliangium sp. TaxID=2663208 RepID=UPI003D09CC2B